MIDMIGVGPFITIPLIVHAMGGPQAMLGWILGAALALCDGMVWAELGSAMPQAGGSYEYLKQTFGPRRWGRWLSFLFVWQLTFSAPLSIASGSIGLAQYAAYLWPVLGRQWFRMSLGLGSAQIVITSQTFVAMSTVAGAALLAYRRVEMISRISRLLWAGVMATMVWVIATGFSHFDRQQAFSFPPGAFHLSHAFMVGLGSALLVSTYDYWGYYNVCFLGGEVRDPERTIPRALVYSILAVAVLYLAMNVGILGVLPWQRLDQAAASNSNFFIISSMMEKVHGRSAAAVVTVLIMWTAFASVFSLLVGYSRVPYAAAIDRNYFSIFAQLHPRQGFPRVSLLVLAAGAIVFSMFRLADVIAALVVIRIAVQFLMQIVGLLLLRYGSPGAPRPFRMWLFPLPALIAAAGFLYVLFERPNFTREIRYASFLVAAGTLIFVVRSWREGQWPFYARPMAHISS